MVERLLHKVAYIVIAFAVLTAVTIGYWLNQSTNVLEIKNQPVPVKVITSDYAETTFNFCKNSPIKGDVEWSLVSKRTAITLPPYRDPTEQMCNDKLKAALPIPPQAPSDTYHYHWKITYKINPLKSVTIEFDSQEFELKR